MTRKRKRGYVFYAFSGDHPPLHVHIFKGSRFIGRWDIESQQPMKGDGFQVSRDMARALRELGYLVESRD